MKATSVLQTRNRLLVIASGAPCSRALWYSPNVTPTVSWVQRGSETWKSKISRPLASRMLVVNSAAVLVRPT